LAEQLFRARLDEYGLVGNGPRVSLSSAGLNTVDGVEMDALAASESAKYGGEPVGALSRSLTQAESVGTDLILVMTREQRVELAKRFPGLLRRIFTLREFARIVDSGGMFAAEAPEEIVPWAFEYRTIFPAARPEDDDIQDPFRRTSEIHAIVAAQIDSATSAIARALSELVARGE
jgi:protein-tyrosine phosphatase